MNEIWWVSGFLEGEGSFSALGGVSPRVTAVQVESEPLEKLVGLFGGTIYPKKPAGFGKKPVQYWYLGGPQAIGLMMTVYPLMSPKRQGQIRKVLSVWKGRGAKFGALHYRSVATDEEALAIMRRIDAGESMNQLEKELGISHTTMSMWMRGTKKPYLRTLLYGDNPPPVVDRSQGAHHRLSSYGDDDALKIIREIRSGKTTVYRAAKSLGLSFNAVSDWCSGKNRPYLLAQVQQEEREALEEVRSWVKCAVI